MAIKVTNNATSVLAAAINTSATLISVAGGDAALFPTFGAGDWCPLTIVDSSGNREIVRATARTGANITVVRAQEGTIARAFPAGARVDLRVTAAIFDSFASDIANKADASALAAKADTSALAGKVDVTGGTMAGDPSVALGVATKQYVDNNLSSAVPASAIAYFARATAPTGWLKANGAAISRTTYATLFAAIGTTFGVGDGSTTFNLPDFRGEFIRGWDDARGVDSGRALGSAQSSQNLSHSHTASTDPGHSHTGVTDTQGTHTHNTTQYAVNAGSVNFITLGTRLNSGATAVDGGLQSAGAHTHNLSINSGGSHTHTINADGGTEARPRNVAALACIKF